MEKEKSFLKMARV